MYGRILIWMPLLKIFNKLKGFKLYQGNYFKKTHRKSYSVQITTLIYMATILPPFNEYRPPTHTHTMPRIQPSASGGMGGAPGWDLRGHH